MSSRPVVLLALLAVLAAGGCARDWPPEVAEPYEWQAVTVPLATGGTATTAFAYARERPRPPGCDRAGDQCEYIAGRVRHGDAWSTRIRTDYQSRNMVPGNLMVACTSDTAEGLPRAELLLSPSLPVVATAGWHPREWQRLEYEFLRNLEEKSSAGGAVYLSLSRGEYAVESASAIATPTALGDVEEFLAALGDPLSYGPDSVLRVRAWLPHSTVVADALLWEFGMGADSGASRMIPEALLPCGLSSLDASTGQSEPGAAGGRQAPDTADGASRVVPAWQLVRAPMDLAPGEVSGVMTAAFGHGTSLTSSDVCDTAKWQCLAASFRDQVPIRLQVTCQDIGNRQSGLLSVAILPPYAASAGISAHAAAWSAGTVWFEAEGIAGREVPWGDSPLLDGHVNPFIATPRDADARQDGDVGLMLEALEDFAGHPKSTAQLVVTVAASPGSRTTPPQLVWEFDLSDPSADSAIGAVVQHCGRWW